MANRQVWKPSSVFMRANCYRATIQPQGGSKTKWATEAPSKILGNASKATAIQQHFSPAVKLRSSLLQVAGSRIVTVVQNCILSSLQPCKDLYDNRGTRTSIISELQPYSQIPNWFIWNVFIFRTMRLIPGKGCHHLLATCMVEIKVFPCNFAWYI